MQLTGAEIICECLLEQGVDTVFGYPGGAALNTYDALYKYSDKIRHILTAHEQGASHAADGYARATGKVGVCMATSGPGATNLVTGIATAYMDSIPVIFISGQVKRADLRDTQHVRQFGIQEVDIISMASSYSKYAVRIKEPEDIRYELEKAAAIAVNGRPGPVWIDVPLDIQASVVEPDSLTKYDGADLKTYPLCEADVMTAIEHLNRAVRPVIILGHGIRLSGSTKAALELVNTLGIPVLTSWNGVDLIEENHPLYFGRPGSVGHRAANFIQQTADYVLTLGTRLNLLSTGYNYESFLKNAYHVMVDIDVNEMNKKSVHPQLKIVCNVADFISAMLSHKDTVRKKDYSSWIDHCRMLCDKYPVFIPEQEAQSGYVSNYHLIKAVSDAMTGDDIYQFTSSGTTVDIAMKTFQIKKGQRAFLTKGLAAMGYDIPASIGSAMASGRRVVCVTGDGSSAMNMQELEVIKRYGLPVKLFIADNKGYSMIYGSQNGNFAGRLTGCTKESGLTLPDMKKIAEAFGIKGMHIDNESNLTEQVREVLDYDGPVVCTYNADITQKILPKQTNYMREDGQMASRPLEDMMPLLDREELAECLKVEVPD